MRKLIAILLIAILAAAAFAAPASKRSAPPGKECGYSAKRAAKSPERADFRNPLDELYYIEGPIPIPDNPGDNTNDTAISVLTIPADVAINDLNVRIIISHSWVRDLYVSLTGPLDTTETILLDWLPQDDADTLDGWFDDEAGVSILDTLAPLVGEWRPVDELSHFDGQSAQGEWTLRVWDRFRLDSGYVAGWGVEINRTVVLSGVVSSSAPRDPIPNVLVEPLPTTSFTRTNSDGFYSFDNLAAGTYTVRFSKRYFDTLTVENVEIVAGQPTTLNATLTPVQGAGVLIEEDFEDVAAGSLPDGWTQVDVDQGSTEDAAFPGPSVWQVYNDEGLGAHSGARFAGNHYNDASVANNDWLILPQLTATGTITLSYWAASQDAGFLENFEVRVSTTGTAPADFTEVVETVSNAPVAWTQHTKDLSDYAGSPFYVAFHYNSTDEFMLKIDDVFVDYSAAVENDLLTPPSDFVFHGNYPNPFNAVTRFQFDLARQTRVSLVLFDVLGRQAAQIANGMFSAGAHELAFDASELPSGIYLARLTAGGAARVHKIVLLR